MGKALEQSMYASIGAIIQIFTKTFNNVFSTNIRHYLLFTSQGHNSYTYFIAYTYEILYFSSIEYLPIYTKYIIEEYPIKILKLMKVAVKINSSISIIMYNRWLEYMMIGWLIGLARL